MKERFGSNDRFPPWTGQEHQARYRFASRYVKGALVVDAACGDGTGSAVYADAGARAVSAFDIAKDCIRAAAEHYPDGKISFEVSDCASLRTQDGSANVFISLETIEHLQEDTRFLKEVSRTLKPDGIFICSTPNRDVTNPFTTLRSKPFNSFHIREYSTSEFESLLRRFFKTVELYGQNRISTPAMKVLRWLRKFMPLMIVVGLQRICKLRWLLPGNTENHQVLKSHPGDTFEFIVAVCKQPILGGEDANG